MLTAARTPPALPPPAAPHRAPVVLAVPLPVELQVVAPAPTLATTPVLVSLPVKR